ncbi:MFS transporter [Teredinibacter franksiae]|uniref:MFS transporter n=1 Tax=Teredinibacter franksiae TaxID=2761453 RepID=UPI001625E7EF|nr:MFS transporter [Teredinibacter franksiae]
MPHSVKMFLVAHGGSAFALGVHQVLLAWLCISALQLPAHQLGWVQAAGLLPNLVVMLIAGALADRRNAIQLMCVAQILLTLCYLLLCVLLVTEKLSLFSLMFYAAAVGCANALIQPAREKVIGSLSEQSVQVKITRASIVQFSMQALGVLVASLSDQTGFLLVISIQALVSALATLQLLLLGGTMRDGDSPAPLVTAKVKRMSSQIMDGFSVVLGDRRIAQLIALISFNGVMHLGLYIVAMPLFARDVYGFNALEYGFLQFCFVLGMLGAYLLLLFRKKVEYPAQGALFSLLYTAIVGYALSREPTVGGLYVLVIFWGWVAGYSATHCRVIMQTLATPEYKGRLMSLYQFTLFGMAPLGALATGYFSIFYSLHTIFQILSGASVVIFVLFLFTKSIWSVKQIG